MKLPPVVIHVTVLLGAALLAAFTAEASEAAVPAQERQDQLIKLVRQECGSCHGLTLAGGLGPPLLPETMADKPLDSMVATVMNGRPGTAMPGWSRFMDEREAAWMVGAFAEGFPELKGAE